MNVRQFTQVAADGKAHDGVQYIVETSGDESLAQAAEQSAAAEQGVVTQAEVKSEPLQPPVDPDERDATLTLASVEALAEITAGYLRAGQVPEAVSLIRKSLQAYDDDVLEHGESPPSMMACSAMRLLLCAVLSRGDCHDLAYQEAQAAASKMDEVWGKRLLGPDGSDGDRAAALREILQAPPPWLVRAVELAVQARQCAATELEFMKDWELEEDADGSEPSEEQSRLLYRRLWEQIAQLHTEAVQLASQLLEKGHPVRESTQRALLLWLHRGPNEDDDSQQQPSLPARCQTPVLAGMLTGQAGPAEAGEDETAWIGNRAWQTLAPARSMPSLLRGPRPLSKHERKFLGLAPLGQGLAKQRKQQMASTVGSSCEPGSMFTVTGCSAASSSMPSMGATLPSLTHSKSSDTYLRGPAKQMMQTSPQWGARGRVPIFFDMTGTGGKAAWALRGGQRRTKRTTASGKEADPFQEWLTQVAEKNSKTKTLGAQVMDDDERYGQIHSELSEKSRLFKNFWMKDEVSPDNLYDMRIRFTDAGIRTFNKSSRKYPKADPRQNWPKLPEDRPPLSALFNHYGVQQGKKVEPGLKSLGALLHKSNESLQRVTARARKERAVERPAERRSPSKIHAPV